MRVLNALEGRWPVKRSRSISISASAKLPNRTESACLCHPGVCSVVYTPLETEEKIEKAIEDLNKLLKEGNRQFEDMRQLRQRIDESANNNKRETELFEMHRKFLKELQEFMQNRSCLLKSEEPERVEFSTFAPRTITPNCSFILDVWAYQAHQYSSIVSKAQELERDVNVGRKTGVSVQKGSILTITIDIENLIVPDPIDTLVWESEPTNASFIIKVPDDAAIGKYPGKAIISYQGIAIAKIVFLISVGTVDTNQYIDHSAESVYPKTAFASYASENREEVLSRIQGMKKVAPDLDIFLDVFSLRSGQNWKEKLEQHVPTKDTFYLFWSEPASRSEWVEREWKLALSRRGLEYIDPVPLEEPDIVPPPQELSALHFSDAYIAYIKYQQIKKNSQIGKAS